MNSKNVVIKKEEEYGKKSKSSDLERADVFRVVISGDANLLLEKTVEQICKGFGNSISKSDVANYVFMNLNRFISEADVKAIRGMHFDDKKVLSSLLKTDDDLPEELKRAIRAHYGLTDREKKRTSRTPSDLSTEPSVDNPSAGNTAA